MLLNLAFAALFAIGAATTPFDLAEIAPAAAPTELPQAMGPGTNAARQASPPAKSTLSTLGEPDLGVFQSVAISAARLPAAGKWQGVRDGDFAALFGDDCTAHFASACDTAFASAIRDATNRAGGLEDRDMLDLVNRTVNSALAYREDRTVWGRGDYWANPVEMARQGAGDCEDFAIAKYWALRELGVSDERMQMVVLQDTRRQLFHAVLVVHTASGPYVLDNVSNRLEADVAYAQYHPIMSFAGDRSYIHGFESGSTSVAAMPADLSAVSPGLGL